MPSDTKSERRKKGKKVVGVLIRPLTELQRNRLKKAGKIRRVKQKRRRK